MHARFYNPQLGRFLSFDPVGGNPRIPQSWNRSSYVLGNPVVLIDPKGELWVASGNASNPYKWVDKCKAGMTCHASVATSVGASLVVYGARDAKDVTSYAANSHGYVNLNNVAQNSSSSFEVKPGSTSYASPETTAAVFNVAEAYRAQFPGSDKLYLTQAGRPDGARRGPSKTHNLGRSIDLRYQDATGRNLQGQTAGAMADITRMNFLVRSATAHGFDQNYSSRPTEFGTGYALGHADHLHLGKSLGNLP